jgi:hypothetical protein
MNEQTRMPRYAQPTPLEIEAYLQRARDLRSEAMAQHAGELVAWFKQGLRSLGGQPPAVRQPCIGC